MDSLNRIARTSESNAQLAVRKPPSLDYVGWLIIEIGDLAVYLRDTNALDAEGVVAQKMAEDLATTRRPLMEQAFAQARVSCKFLPRTVELLQFYSDAWAKQLEAERKARDAEWQAEQRRIDEDARLHPEKYISFGEIVREAAPMREHVAKVEGRAAAAKAQQAAEDNAPKIAECPHCGKPIPLRVADLRGLSIEHLESLIEGKKLYNAQHNANLAAAHESLLLAIAAAREQDAAMKRKGEAARARLAGEPPPPTPKKTCTRKGNR